MLQLNRDVGMKRLCAVAAFASIAAVTPLIGQQVQQQAKV